MPEPTRPKTCAQLDTPVAKLVAHIEGKLALRAGDQLFPRWSTADAHLFDASSETRVQ